MFEQAASAWTVALNVNYYFTTFNFIVNLEIFNRNVYIRFFSFVLNIPSTVSPFIFLYIYIFFLIKHVELIGF